MRVRSGSEGFERARNTFVAFQTLGAQGTEEAEAEAEDPGKEICPSRYSLTKMITVNTNISL